MKRTLFLIIVLLLPFSFAQAATRSPKLTVIDHIDLGKVQTGKILEKPLALQNTGDADLVISSVTSDCPCTSFQVPDKDGKYQPLQPESKVTILPGEKVELKLIFDSNKTKFRGAFKKLIVIGSNDPEVPIMRVEMVGEIIEPPAKEKQ